MGFNKHENNKRLAIVFAILSAVSFGLVPLAIKKIDIELTLCSLMAIVGARSFISALMLYGFVGPKDFDFIPRSKYEFRIILCKCLFNTGWIGALATQLPSKTAVIILFCHPIYTTIIKGFTEKKLQKRDYRSSLIGISGLLISLVDQLKAGSIIGILLVFGGSLAISLLFLSNDKVKKERKINVFSLAEMYCGILILFFFFAPLELNLNSITAIGAGGVLGAFGMGFLAQATKGLQSDQAAQLMFFQPITTIIVGVLVLGEQASIFLFIGTSLIITACYIKFR